MSGEAYGNVQSEDIDTASIYELRHLLADLAKDGRADDLALAVLRVVGRREDLERQFEALNVDWNELYGPLKAFNYWHSADSSEDAFFEALVKWREDQR